MNPNFQIGPLSFHFYGLILSAALLVVFLVAKFQALKEKLPQGIVEEAAVILVIPAIIGARVYHVAHFWDFYSKNPVAIFFIWQGGIGIIGALIAGIATLYFFAKWRRLNFFKLGDLAAPAVLLGQSIGRIGNFVNNEGFGPPTNLPWGVYIKPEARPEVYTNFTYFHPTFFYESLGDALIFLILILLPGKISGLRFSVYLILYSVLRFGLEFLRIDTWNLGIIKMAQVISFVGLLAGVYLTIKILKPKWIFKFLA